MSSLRTSVLLVASLTLLLGACSSGSSSNDTTGGGRDVVGNLSDSAQVLTDSQNPTGDAKTDDDVIIIPPGAECVLDEHCDDVEYCDCHYECQPRFDSMCFEDSNCDAGFYCEPCGRTCEAQRSPCDPCISENRCDLSTGICERVGQQCESPNANSLSHCLDFGDGHSYCGWACMNNYGCNHLPGFECLELPGIDEGQCVPLLATCGTSSDCETDVDCPYGEICNDYKLCASGCQDDGGCPTDQVCSAFRCQEACDDLNNPCAEGWECDETGHCKIPGSCVDWVDCPTPVTFCDPADNMCKPGCRDDHDCGMSGYVCVDNDCEKQGCEHNWYCAFEQECDFGTGDCVDAVGPYCDTCDPNVENDCGEGNECIGLQDEDGNALGDFCFVQCKNVDYTGDRCPQGYQCAPLQDESGQTQNEVCFRDCSTPPVGGPAQ